MLNLVSSCDPKAGSFWACTLACLVFGISSYFVASSAAETKVGNVLEETVLLDFTASWCGPCQRMAPLVDQLIGMGYPVRKVDIDREPALAKRFGIQAVPTFVMLVNGREAKRIVGGAGLDDLIALCRLAPRAGSPSDSQSVVLTSATSSGVSPASTGVFPLRGAALSDKAGARPATIPETIPPLDENCRFAAANEQDLIAVTARIRVEDPHGRSTGSGTIIDARGGEALIVTCGHLFRDSHGKTPILVDLFGPNAAQGIPAQLIYYDDRLDIGFISIRPNRPVVVARVAAPGYPLAVGDAVFSVGCTASQPPSVWEGRITALNKYLGPANIEASRAPFVGRSGGGLFSNEGFLIGVCNAADPPLDEGIYLALQEIHQSLDQLNLAFVYRWDAASRGMTGDPQVAQNRGQLAVSGPGGGSSGRGETENRFGQPQGPSTGLSPESLTLATGLPLPIPMGDLSGSRTAQAMGTLGVPVPSGGMPSATVVPVGFVEHATLSLEEQATLEEIRRRQAQGHQVVCIVQPADQPNSTSEIIVVRSPSPQLLAALSQAGVKMVMPGDLPSRTVGEIPSDPFSARLGQQASDSPLVPIPAGAVLRIGTNVMPVSGRAVAGTRPGTAGWD
ncbi:MAG: trypsin-like peptidase domain-containing protein [Thermogutta sp.]|nr:thioredoxin domain-containing protein [Thermogutta sp.]